MDWVDVGGGVVVGTAGVVVEGDVDGDDASGAVVAEGSVVALVPSGDVVAGPGSVAALSAVGESSSLPQALSVIAVAMASVEMRRC